jgi:hypothetical protein
VKKAETMKILVIIGCMLVCSSVFADCRTVNNRVVCNSGEGAAGYNSRTGNAWKAEENDAGIKTIESSRGGKAKAKNGRAIYTSPNGTFCIKTKNKLECKN